MRLNPQKSADLVTFTEEILNGKFHFLCRVYKVRDHSFGTYEKPSEKLTLLTP